MLIILATVNLRSATLAPELTQGLVAYYSFNNNLNDSTGLLSPVLNYGTTYSNGPISGVSALCFNLGQYGAISGLGSKISSAVTVSGWYKFDSGLTAPLEYGSGFKAVMYSGTLPDGSNPCFRINAQVAQGQSQVHFQLNLGESSLHLQNPSYLINPNTWYYVTVVTQSGGPQPFWEFYVNGALRGSGNNGVPSSLNFNYDYGVGSTIEAGSAYWGTYSQGGIADLAFYDRALSSSEVLKLFTAESIPEPSALSLLAIGLGVVLRRRRRTV